MRVPMPHKMPQRGWFGFGASRARAKAWTPGRVGTQETEDEAPDAAPRKPRKRVHLIRRRRARDVRTEAQIPGIIVLCMLLIAVYMVLRVAGAFPR